MGKRTTCHSNLKPFTSYRKSDGGWYVIIDLQHAWSGELPTDRVEKVCLMNVQTEEIRVLPVEDFQSFLDNGTLYKAIKNG